MSELNATEENTQLIIINKGTSAGGANTTLKERVEWAVNKPDDVVKNEGITKEEQRENFKNKEKIMDY